MNSILSEIRVRMAELVQGNARRRRRRVTSSPEVGIERLEVRQLLSAVSALGAAENNDAGDVAALSDSSVPERPSVVDVRPGRASVRVSWTESASADSYEIWVNNRVTGEQQVIREDELTSPSYTIVTGRGRPGGEFGSLADGYYRVWVRATNTAGDSPWSEPADFTLGDPDPLTPPTAPSVTSPTGVNVAVRPTITWTASDQTDTYELWVSDTTSGGRVIHEPNLSATSWDVEQSLPAGTFRVWVRAANVVGNTPWSEPFEFSIPLAEAAPEGPSIIDVRPGRASVRVTWTESASADSYEIWVNNRVTGEQQVIREDELTSPSYTIVTGRGRPGGEFGSLADGYYRVWVRATNTGGDSPWSEPADFTLGDPDPLTPPTAPSVTSPTGVNVAVRPTITWTASDQTDTYELWVSDTTSGGRIIHEPSLSATSWDVEHSLPAGTFRVWVRAANVVGNSPWSEPFEFSVPLADAAPEGPSIIDVRPGRASVRVTWTESASADSYEIWINNRVTGEQQVIREDELTSPSYTIVTGRGRRGGDSGSLADGYYRVWVRATNTGGDSPWSEPADFTLGDPDPLTPPTAPSVTSPTGVNVAVRPTITWTASEQTGTYELWVSDTTSGGRVIHEPNLSATSWDVEHSLPAGTFRVWVRAANVVGNSPWSEPFEFSVPLADAAPEGPSIIDVRPGRASVRVTWTESAAADSYEIWINNRVTGEQQVIREDELTSPSYTIVTGRGRRGGDSGSLADGYYRVWVRATNTAGDSPWSEPADFTLGDV